MERVILSEKCNKCGSTSGRIDQSGPHRKLSCFDCGNYIKMIGKAEVFIPEHTDEDIKEIVKEINFKLDVIIDHLGIKE